MFINYYCCSSTHLCKPSLKKKRKKGVCSDFNTKRAPSGRDPRLCGKVIQTIISKYNMPKDYNYHCSFVWSYNNENVYFRLFSLCIKHIKL